MFKTNVPSLIDWKYRSVGLSHDLQNGPLAYLGDTRGHQRCTARLCFAWVGLTKPKPLIKDKRSHDSVYQLAL